MLRVAPLSVPRAAPLIVSLRPRPRQALEDSQRRQQYAAEHFQRELALRQKVADLHRDVLLEHSRAQGRELTRQQLRRTVRGGVSRCAPKTLNPKP